jgi:asparagine synthase (glutamine-hydrolysing)
MCGICGILHFDHRRPATAEAIETMVATMHHRGPDERGCHIDRGLGIGAARLSILDLETGRQPVASEDRRLAAVLNGEIYNSDELRTSLARHKPFRTRTDTEILVHLYDDAGLELLTHLNGMFAFALWDAGRQRLILARDPAGQKPLYFQRTESAFAFASEPKAIFAWSHELRRLRREAVSDYLAYDYTPQPDTVYVSIEQVPPGHYAVVSVGGQVEIVRYWEPRFAYIDWKAIGGDASLAAAIRDRFRASVERHLAADVPVGAFLSGGIDSSSIVALAREAGAASSLRTYSARFGEAGFDEGRYIQSVVDAIGTNHTDVPISAETFLVAARELIDVLDEPVPDPSIVTRYIIARTARRDVKVLLSGDGGDELFAGYPTFHSQWILSLVNRLPAPAVRSLVDGLKRLAPVGTGNFSLRYVLDRFGQSVGLSPEVAVQTLIRSFAGCEIADVLAHQNGRADRTNDLCGALLRWAHRNRALTGTERLSLFYFNWYLPYDLAKVDRAGMAASIEVRAPFLDRDMLEIAFAIPETYKIRGTQLKYVFRRAMDGVVPADVLARGKRGFSVPVGAWLKGPLAGWMTDTLEAERIRTDGVFDPSIVSALADAHLAGQADNGRALWSLMMFALWQRRHGIHLDQGRS